MNNLYQNKNKLFPVTIDITGNKYIINADYRAVLRIFAILQDRDVSEYKRVEKLIQWFFAGDLPENITLEMINAAFADFVNPPKETGSDGSDRDGESLSSAQEENQYDYDFDAEEIYASFIAEYGIDLIEVEFLHWYKFKILLSNLSPESAFKRKIELRFMDLSPYKGQALADMTRAKEAVQLPVEYSDDELQEMREFEDLWGKL